MIDLKLFNRWNLPKGHFIFSQTFAERGKTLVWPIMVTERRSGVFGFLYSWLLLRVFKVLMWFLAFQDGRVIYKNLRFNQSGLLADIDQASAKWIAFANKTIVPSIWSNSLRDTSKHD
jgi:hypothetical protein